MGEAFIVRKGGAAVERTTAPSINFVSKTGSEIVVTFTNNDAAEAEVYYGITSTLTDTVTLAAAATSSNITFSGLDDDTAFTVSAYALVTDPTSKKIKSEIVFTVITTDAITFTAATGGTTLEYDSGGKRFKSHTFNSNGTFEVTAVGNGDRNQVDYLIIAGGGGGGKAARFDSSGSGGGAGGFRTTSLTQGGLGTLDAKVTVTTTSFGVTIGAGGAGSTTSGVRGSSGATSQVAFSSTITSTGGGGAGSVGLRNGLNGGSGGGGNGSPVGLGTANQGFDGGTGGRTGGGGGAGQVGQNQDGNVGGAGGNGLANNLRTGSNETRGGGGGAGGYTDAGGAGGAGGGGTAGANVNTASESGQANTGGGGGGGTGDNGGSVNQNGASGGSGIVVIRYEIATV